MKLFGYALVKESELHRLEDIELRARRLVYELDNDIPCGVMKQLHRNKINKLTDKSRLYK